MRREEGGDGGVAHPDRARPRRTAAERADGRAGRDRRRRDRLHAVPDLPAAPAADLDLHRRVPRRRAVGPGHLPAAVHAPRLRDHARLHRADPDPDRARRDADPAGRRAAQQPDQQPARLRPGHPGLRGAQRAAAADRAGLQHHRGAAEAGEHAARSRRRRRGDPLRHRARPRQLDLRRCVDPDPEPVHDRLGALVAGVVRPPSGRRTRGRGSTGCSTGSATRSATTSPARWLRPSPPRCWPSSCSRSSASPTRARSRC